jgi:tRNA uridine 5-carboxymethylaminomethyl modification enzyme
MASLLQSSWIRVAGSRTIWIDCQKLITVPEKAGKKHRRDLQSARFARHFSSAAELCSGPSGGRNSMHGTSWDVVVIGGGHAGCEAAAAAARCGVRTLLLTQKFSTIGVMSCNPSIGGVGKGHLVREIDALGGVMGLAADEGGIQFRVLNESKGPAVRGPRAQMDRLLYKAAVVSILEQTPNLTIAEGTVKDLILGEDGSITGLAMGADGRTSDDDWSLRTRRVIVTTGTFLHGMIHVGRVLTPAGRVGDAPSTALADTFARVGFKMGRLKTGTPPRIKGSSIDTSQMEVQHGDDIPKAFSFLNKQPKMGNKVLCWSTRTNSETHQLVQHYRSESPIFDGADGKGHGPRYCPSLDVKGIYTSYMYVCMYVSLMVLMARAMARGTAPRWM